MNQYFLLPNHITMYDAFVAYQDDKEFEAYLIVQQNKESPVSVGCEESEKIFSQEIGEVLEKKLPDAGAIH